MNKLTEDKNKAYNAVYILTTYIEDELFPKLKEEYKLDDNVIFYMPDNLLDYVIHQWLFRYQYLHRDTYWIMNELQNDYIGQSFAATHYDWDEEENCLKQRIILPKPNIVELVLRSIDLSKNSIDMNLLKKYVEMVLRHECGHALHHLALIEEIGDDVFFERNEQYDNKVTEYFEYCDELENDEYISEEEFYWLSNKKYYTIENEVMANKYAGIDTDELIKLEMLVKHHIEV